MFVGARSHAFPNVGFDFQEVIQKQHDVLNKQEQDDNFRFGIFGSFEFRTSTHRFETSWQDVLRRIRLETDEYAKCDNGAQACNSNIGLWRKLIADLNGLPADAQLTRLNKAINRMARYADDTKAFGKKDHWATPAEFLKGQGDCEDFATIKYRSLLELGFSDEQLRLAIVRDTRRGILHAVVTVAFGDRTLVLDSLFDHVIEQRHILKYVPVYSTNQDTQYAHIVTKKLRLAYLDRVERRLRDQVKKATVLSAEPSAALPSGNESHGESRKTPKFVD